MKWPDMFSCGQMNTLTFIFQHLAIYVYTWEIEMDLQSLPPTLYVLYQVFICRWYMYILEVVCLVRSTESLGQSVLIDTTITSPTTMYSVGIVTVRLFQLHRSYTSLVGGTTLRKACDISITHAHSESSGGIFDIVVWGAINLKVPMISFLVKGDFMVPAF